MLFFAESLQKIVASSFSVRAILLCCGGRFAAPSLRRALPRRSASAHPAASREATATEPTAYRPTPIRVLPESAFFGHIWVKLALIWCE